MAIIAVSTGADVLDEWHPKCAQQPKLTNAIDQRGKLLLIFRRQTVKDTSISDQPHLLVHGNFLFGWSDKGYPELVFPCVLILLALLDLCDPCHVAVVVVWASLRRLLLSSSGACQFLHLGTRIHG